MSVQVTDTQPSPVLREFVQGYKLIESEGEVVNQLLPGTGLALAFRLRGDVGQVDANTTTSLPVSTVSGLRTSMREIRYRAGSRSLIVLLSAAGAARLFREPLHEFFNQTVALEDVDPGAKELQNSLNNATTLLKQAQLVDAFLTCRILTRDHDLLMHEAVRRITVAKGIIRIRDLSSDLCLSQDAFEKRFRRAIGATAKQFSTIVRMRAIVEQKSPELAQISYDYAFHDVAHFTRSFKQFTGKTPAAFFSGQQFW